jgi:RNA polymerase sigma factor (sigma-70 family)
VNIDSTDAWLRACTNGDKQAWDRFVQANARLIYAAVQRLLIRRGGGGLGEIDDRVQDVFVRLVRNDFRLLKTFDSNRASLSTWLTLVTRSIVNEHLKKRSLNTVALQPEEPDRSDDRPDSIDDQRSLNDSSLPLHLLTERQLLVLQMLFEQGLSVEQAAGRIGVDAQTIRSTKHKALSRLRQEMPAPPHAGKPHIPGDI